MVALAILYYLVCIGMYIVNGLAFFRLAKLAGRGDVAWMAWVPVCNLILQLLLIKKHGAWVLMYLVPFANMVFVIIWHVKMLNAFGKNGAYVLFGLFLTPVYAILWIVWAYSKDTRYVLNDVSAPTFSQTLNQ